ncbi:MAG TPA: rod shape-determining protein MreC [candidate division Zixibacteria bacterium]
MLRRLWGWSSHRPAGLPWAILFSLLLLLSGSRIRLFVAGAVVEFVYAPLFALRHRISAGADVLRTNERLTERLAQLEIENQRLREAGIENQRLRELLGFAPGWEGRVIPAEVIGPFSPQSGTLWIQTARDKSPQRNWPVVTSEGLLGRIIDPDVGRSRVRTLWDRLLRVAAYDQRSRVGGIIAWEQGTQLRLHHVSRSADIAIGDTVLSSGWGGIFPKGLMIGTVARIDSATHGDFLGIDVEPTVRPDRIETVFVIEPIGSDEPDAEIEP